MVNSPSARHHVNSRCANSHVGLAGRLSFRFTCARIFGIFQLNVFPAKSERFRFTRRTRCDTWRMKKVMRARARDSGTVENEIWIAVGTTLYRAREVREIFSLADFIAANGVMERF